FHRIQVNGGTGKHNSINWNIFLEDALLYLADSNTFFIHVQPGFPGCEVITGTDKPNKGCNANDGQYPFLCPGFFLYNSVNHNLIFLLISFFLKSYPSTASGRVGPNCSKKLKPLSE